ncbi:flavin reductase (DIM6/NTAB) family NADH-FMN oxidoreductase RutF [Arthrobacter sp. AG367]|uniref:flavin reductase family protein n=1 Tax=Arthrobacter sp. AG367 TaxID=2572909 RepID=UPI0011A593FA|nr:flavin reductase family protein [Arthrobacter sp. AG367]TWD46761.1 flavin reductase (DIM6/NTAB) family NADH-FMN oxidoreductase RutF [Arthrobacter sp. AG367]
MHAPVVNQEISAEDFKFAFRHHPAGVGIITADVGNGPVAMTVSSLASVGINPPSLVFSASPMSSSTQTICAAETVVVHLLASDQVELAKLGATSGVNRFGDDVEWARLRTGEPYYPNANSWLRGRVVNRIDVSGSTLIVVEAIEAKPRDENERSDAAPLVYHNRKWFALGEHAALS